MRTLLKNVLTPLSKSELEVQEQETLAESRWWRALIAFDQMCNVIFFNGIPDETISSHSARESLKNVFWAVSLSCWLNSLQKDHGADATAGDLERAEVVIKLEEDGGLLPPDGGSVTISTGATQASAYVITTMPKK